VEEVDCLKFGVEVDYPRGGVKKSELSAGFEKDVGRTVMLGVEKDAHTLWS
jgi:hypothetical protein